MFILIDRTNLKMVAVAKTQQHIGLISDVDFSNVATVIFSAEDGRGWAMLSRDEIKKLYENMSGEKAPEYGIAVTELRAYSESWDEYSRSVAELQREYHAVEIEQEEKYDIQLAAQKARQAAIEIAAASRFANEPESQSAPITQPAIKAKRRLSAPPSKSGATKRVWEICDEAVSSGLTDLKAIRAKAKDQAVREGINEGTFGVQFGKWKTANSK